ncbi:MAG: hypothetical protein M2R45_04185 [Verrucomicrobia subdivision 3 bacterium]|nr:hypothetical protein [Limisphaerales bacterium]MCS1413010.1 hypothetical protein [Limisphaerales bacterium]
MNIVRINQESGAQAVVTACANLVGLRFPVWKALAP